HDAAIALGYEAAHVAADAHDDAIVAGALGRVAFLLGAGKQRFEAADVAYRTALAATARAGNPTPLLERVYGDRAGVLLQRGDYAGALPLAALTYALSVSVYGVDSYQAAGSLMDVAALMNHLGDLGAARRMCDAALATAEKALGPEHPV